jgi:hypothetical protein
VTDPHLIDGLEHHRIDDVGHSSIGITLDTYSHVLPSMQAEAAKAVDEIFGAA